MTVIVEEDVLRCGAGRPEPYEGGFDDCHCAEVAAVERIVPDKHLSHPERNP